MFNRIISLILSFSMMFLSFFSFFNSSAKELRILVPDEWEMDVGDSRTLECVFKDKEHTGAITWSVSPDEVAVIDDHGRITVTGIGQAAVTAQSGSLHDTVTLHATSTPTIIAERKAIQRYKNGAAAQVNNLQKIVTRYAKGDSNVPADVSSVSDYTAYQSAVTADGAVWTITGYGVLRTDDNAPTLRDREQRFMGDRYFYSADTTDGKVLAIYSDGDNGIWTTMQNGYTHIAMVEMDGTQKAEIMSDTTQAHVARRGMVSEAYGQNNDWRT